MKMVRVVLGAVVAALVVVVAATGCGGGSDSSNASAASGGDCKAGDSPVITLAAYSNPYDAYGKLTSTFAADWKESHSDQQVIFQMSSPEANGPVTKEAAERWLRLLGD